MAQWKGAEVFANTGCTGKTDIVLKIDGNLVEIDVKLAHFHPRDKCWNCPTVGSVKLPVYPVLVLPEGDIMDWKIRWKNSTKYKKSPPHCPPGLEDFWSKPSTNV